MSRAPSALAIPAVALTALAIYTLFIAFASQRGFPPAMEFSSRLPFLSDKPVGEDGYYLMLAAWNLGSGQGLTANFGEPVTGVQPLLTLALAGFAAGLHALGLDKYALAQTVILFGGLLLAIFAALMARIAARLAPAHGDIAGAAVFIGCATSFYLWRTFTYGLETGLYLTLVALLLDRLLLWRDARSLGARDIAWAGAITGLCGLARIDFGLVAAVGFGVMLLQRRVGFAQAAAIAALAFAITLPWFIWVKRVSGSWMPTSGGAQAELVTRDTALGRLDAMASAVAQNLTPTIPVQGDIRIALVAGLIFILLAVIARPGFSAPALRAWTLAFALLPPIYFAFFWAAHFYARYTALLSIVGLLVLGFAAARLFARRPAPMLAAWLVVALTLSGVTAWRDLHSGRSTDGHAVVAGFVHDRLPREARVGLFQSGVTGYFNPNVLNLDGKVNADALKALRDKQVAAYLDRAGVDYVVDWQGVIEGLIPGVLSDGRWTRCPADPRNDLSICIMRPGKAFNP